jgi:hypothetical protein
MEKSITIKLTERELNILISKVAKGTSEENLENPDILVSRLFNKLGKLKSDFGRICRNEQKLQDLNLQQETAISIIFKYVDKKYHKEIQKELDNINWHNYLWLLKEELYYRKKKSKNE